MINMIFKLNENKILTEKDFKKKYENFDEFCDHFDRIEDVMTWYKYNNVRWPTDEDKEDANNRPFSWPDDILKTKIGNCWDHAIFFYSFCKRKNIPAKMYRFAIWGKLIDYKSHKYGEMECFGHIVCICKLNTGYYVCDYFGSVKDSTLFGPYESFENCAKHYSNMYGHMFKTIYIKIFDGYEKYDSFTKTFYSVIDNKDVQLYYKYYNNHNITQTDIFNLQKSAKFEYDNHSTQRNIIDDLQIKFKYYIRLFGKKIFEWGS